MMKNLFYISLILSIIQIPGNLYIQAFISVLLFFIFLINIVSKKVNISKLMKPSFLLLTLWMLLSLISWFWVKDYEGWLIYTIVIFIVWSLNNIVLIKIEDNDFIYNIFKIQIILNLIHNIIAWFELLSGRYLFFNSPEMIRAATLFNNPLSFFTNTNDFAFYLLFSVLVLIHWQPNKLKWFRIVMIFSNIILIISTDSRAMYIALLVGMLFILYLSIKKKTVKIFVGFFTISFIVVSIFSVGLTNTIQLDNLNMSDNIRINLIKSGFQYLSDNLFFGIGAGNGPFYLQNIPAFSVYGQYEFHNWWIEILVLYGVPFFAIYICYYARTMILYFKLALKPNGNIAKIGFVWLASFIIGSMSSSTIFPRIWVWIVMLIIFNYAEVLKKQKIKQSDN